FFQVLAAAQGVDPTAMPGGPKRRAASPRQPKAAKPTQKKASDTAAVADAIAELQLLYESAKDPDCTFDTIKQTVQRIHDGFDANGLKAVAKGFGLTAGLTNKGVTKERIEKKITDRKGAAERGDSIERAAQPHIAAAQASSSSEPDVILDAELASA